MYRITITFIYQIYLYLYGQTTVRGRRSFTRCPAEVHLPIPLNVRPVAVSAYGMFLTCESDEGEKKRKKEKASEYHTSSSNAYRT